MTTQAATSNQVQVLEFNGFAIAEGAEEIALVECLEFAKSLPGGYWVEAAADWFMEEGLSGYVVGYGITVQAQVRTIAEARLYLSQQEAPAEEESEVILEALAGVEPKLPKRQGTKIARFLEALQAGATEAQLQAIIGANKATVREFIYYVCRSTCKAFGCKRLNGKYLLIQPAQ